MEVIGIMALKRLKLSSLDQSQRPSCKSDDKVMRQKWVNYIELELLPNVYIWANVGQYTFDIQYTMTHWGMKRNFLLYVIYLSFNILAMSYSYSLFPLI